MSQMNDIRDLLLKQMQELADSDANADEVKVRVSRAQASANVALAYVSTIDAELNAIRLFDNTGVRASIIEAGTTRALK
jgi:hypothetical protein